MLGARPRPLRRSPRAAERKPARRRARWPAPPFPIDRAMTADGAGLRPADGQFARRRLRPRLRAGVPGRRRHPRHPSLAPRRGAGALDQRRLRLRAPGRCLHDRQLDHAAEAQPRRRRAGARQGRAASSARWSRLPWCWGLPLAYGKDMQEDKETGVRRRRRLALSLAAMAGMVARHGGRRRRHAPRRAAAASSPRPISPTGWCASSACRSARRITSPARWCALAEAEGLRPRRADAGRDADASSPRITAAVYDVLDCRGAVASRTSYGGTAPAQVRAPWRQRGAADGGR